MVAQGSAKELIAELESGDSTRCMNAGNATSHYQEHYQQLAAELATPLFDILENGLCSGSALTALVNVGDGVAEGVDGERAMRALVTIVEKGLAEGASFEAASDAGSAVLVIGHFGEGGAPAVPVLVRWIRERADAFDRRYGLMTLAEIGDGSAPAVPELLPFLAAPAEDDENAWEKKELRTMVAQTLGSIPTAAAVSAPALVAGLSDPDYNYRYAAGESVAKIGSPMVPYLLPVLGSAEPETKKEVLEILSGMGTGVAEAAPVI
ncbi:MAG TPA: HEAT repeat domain-containing protein, partial [Gammaproteobacteria bacterium]|nr:HEAT repeat domain-containing protein [Gammaproteobacteria bacterium]